MGRAKWNAIYPHECSRFCHGFMRWSSLWYDNPRQFNEKAFRGPDRNISVWSLVYLEGELLFDTMQMEGYIQQPSESFGVLRGIDEYLKKFLDCLKAIRTQEAYKCDIESHKRVLNCCERVSAFIFSDTPLIKKDHTELKALLLEICKDSRNDDIMEV